jgi:hypothetical protein
VIAFTVALYALWSLHTESKNIQVKPNKFEWQQPSSLVDKFPTLISTAHWKFDYEATEQALLAIQVSNTKNLILNAHTAKILEKAISNLPSKMSKTELERVGLLTAKGLPGKAGQQLATVLTNFYHYQQAIDIVKATANTSSITTSKQQKQSKETIFKQSVERQKNYLGEDTAEQLFGKQNALNAYLYSRKRINEDTNLSPAQKQAELTTLQARFKAHDQ